MQQTIDQLRAIAQAKARRGAAREARQGQGRGPERVEAHGRRERAALPAARHGRDRPSGGGGGARLEGSPHSRLTLS